MLPVFFFFFLVLINDCRFCPSYHTTLENYRTLHTVLARPVTPCPIGCGFVPLTLPVQWTYVMCSSIPLGKAWSKTTGPKETSG